MEEVSGLSGQTFHMISGKRLGVGIERRKRGVEKGNVANKKDDFNRDREMGSSDEFAD